MSTTKFDERVDDGVYYILALVFIVFGAWYIDKWNTCIEKLQPKESIDSQNP